MSIRALGFTMAGDAVIRSIASLVAHSLHASRRCVTHGAEQRFVHVCHTSGCIEVVSPCTTCAAVRFLACGELGLAAWVTMPPPDSSSLRCLIELDGMIDAGVLALGEPMVPLWGVAGAAN